MAIIRKITTLVNVRDTDEPCDVYIGRGGKWGNPFRIGKEGTRKQVIAKYKKWILKNKRLMNSLGELEGKVLGCYCWPLPCHGDVLIELVKEQKGNSK